MVWSEVRSTYPNRWLIVEALAAHTDPEQHRHLENLAVLEVCSNGKEAMEGYRQLHRQHPRRELYFVHTGREKLEIQERHWLGIRGAHAAEAPA